MKTINLTDKNYNDLITCLSNHGEIMFVEFLEKCASDPISYQEAIKILEKWGNHEY